MEVKLTPYQYEFLQREDQPLAIMSCGVSAGKTYIASWYIAMQLCKGKRMLAGAQNFLALTRVLMSEVIKRLEELHINYEYRKQDKEIVTSSGGHLYGYSGESPEGILGLSDIDLLVIDEASYVPVEAYNFAADRLRGPHVTVPKVRLITSPDSFNPSHAWFLELVRKHPESVIYASALDNPFTSDAFKKQLLERYPVGTNLYKQQVLGQILDSDYANVIIKYEEFPKTAVLHPGTETFMGIDYAGTGRDATVFLVRDNKEILEVVYNHDGKVETDNAIYDRLWMKYHPRIAYDSTGGWSRGAQTLHLERKALGVNFGSKDEDADYVNNKRTGMYLRFREAVIHGFYIDPVKYADIRKEIQYTTYFVGPNGKTCLTPKDKIKELLGGKSPDALDALVLSFEAENSKMIEHSPQDYSTLAADIARQIG